jgi:hypothetical protein
MTALMRVAPADSLSVGRWSHRRSSESLNVTERPCAIIAKIDDGPWGGCVSITGIAIVVYSACVVQRISGQVIEDPHARGPFR